MKCLEKLFAKPEISNDQPFRERMKIPPVIEGDLTQRPYLDAVIPTFKISKRELYPLATRIDLDPDRGGVMMPTHVVHHYVVGYKTEPTVQYFKTNGVDIHFVIGHNGEVIQMSELNRQCAHAGESRLGQLRGFNNFSIGIEHVNLGPLQSRKDGKIIDYYGRKYSGELRERIGLGHKFWEPLTPAQEQRTLEIALYLFLAYKIPPENHVGHYEISGFRGKADPFGSYSWGDMNEVRKQISLYIQEHQIRSKLK